MPNYDYRCKFCSFEYELFKKMSEIEDEKELCPQCGSECKRKISGGTGIIFKGDGFYINDYKKKEKK